MIDWESLLEFEDAITTTNPPKLLRQALDAKLTDKLMSLKPSTTDFTEEQLDTTFQSYSFEQDQFTSCSKCGHPLSSGSSTYKNCCNTFIENKSQISSGLEKSYWLSLINNPSGTINTLPNYTQMLILQQGIPAQLRSLIWERLLLLGSEVPETSSLIYENFQHSYNPSVAKQISKDLHRTFPSVPFFKLDSTESNLSTILNVFANYDAELGYCQGLVFLVGVLYYHFQHESPALTFHSLVVIMAAEPELRDIFTATTMSKTLEKWLSEFLDILNVVEPDLHDHMLSNGIEFQVFLYQWWLSFASSHVPELSIINRIMDVCLVQGWKAGLFKVSLGLLKVNKPILMSLGEGDEEVVYQHLLNESRWGVTINDLDLFFGNTLMSFDDELFIKQEPVFIKPVIASSLKYSHTRTPSSVMDKFKQLSVNLTRSRSNSDHQSPDSISSSSSSSLSVFESTHLNEQESIYSDDVMNDECSSSTSVFNYLKLPYSQKKDDVSKDQLKELLRQAYEMVEGKPRDEMVMAEIKRVLT
ncbi:hypothetical protein CAAN1_24S00210 [[Candida] anglica]|uniref:Rab-GAP TBC domain-containing protein n=1 Tax=[Candida] anglica TaxID=148631 RepID=A0ABP0EDR7_9ASCO